MLYNPFPFELILDYNIFEQFAGFLPFFDPLRQTLTLWNINKTVIGNRPLFASLWSTITAAANMKRESETLSQNKSADFAKTSSIKHVASTCYNQKAK